VAACGGCHVLHDSRDGASVRLGSGGEALLLADSATEVCLGCHGAGLGRVLDGTPTSPPPERGAGNFVFLAEENLNDATNGLQNWIPGERAGHNLNSADHGLQHDLRWTFSPGGDYPSERLGCTSCHDPHGNDQYRLLYDAGQTTPDGFVYTWPAPRALGLPFSETQETTTSHVAYLEGWSQWCANCHGFYHETLQGGFEHPVQGPLDSAHRDIYNTYDGTVRPQSGDVLSAYLPEVPLQDPGASPESAMGAGPSSEISCMSCHRAHAASAPAALRWDPNVLRLVDDGLISGSWPLPNPYGDPQQTSLCNKCHAMETRSHPSSPPCLGCHGGSSGGGSGTDFIDPGY